MICYVIKNGVPFDVAHCMEDWDLLAHSVTFAKLDNGDLDFDWDSMRFIERS